MSTNDVPGAKPSNHDELGSGSWAEHADGSLIYVAGTENGRVIFEIFDLSDDERPVEYRDAMPKKLFEQKFSWDGKGSSVRWTWHDKTPFPWDRILRHFKEGVKPVSAQQFIEDAMAVHSSRERISGEDDDDDAPRPGRRPSAARQAAKGRKLKPELVLHADIAQRVDKTLPAGGVASRVRKALQKAIDDLTPGK